LHVTLDCPNDRYVNDEAICQAVVPMLSPHRRAAEAELADQVQALRQDRRAAELEHQLLYAGLDAGQLRRPQHALQHHLDGGGPGSGSNNSGRYNNPRVNDLTARIGVETDQEKRSAMIQEAMKIHKEDFGHIPLHQQALAWAIRDTVAFLP
ncbi:Uncharacterized protein APZ42_005987, partial [Daphnia magna]